MDLDGVGMTWRWIVSLLYCEYSAVSSCWFIRFLQLLRALPVQTLSSACLALRRMVSVCWLAVSIMLYGVKYLDLSQHIPFIHNAQKYVRCLGMRCYLRKGMLTCWLSYFSVYAFIDVFWMWTHLLPDCPCILPLIHTSHSTYSVYTPGPSTYTPRLPTDPDPNDAGSFKIEDWCTFDDLVAPLFPSMLYVSVHAVTMALPVQCTWFQTRRTAARMR